jgi:TusA-related sulfurtransferase
MATTDWTSPVFDAAGVPDGRPVETLDVRSDPPPEPLKRTLEALAGMDGDAVLVQRNDRVPRHLFPRLADRGYDHETIETDAGVLTAIWA